MDTIKGMFTEITAKELWLATLIVAVIGVTAVVINNGAADEIVANASSMIESVADWTKGFGSHDANPAGSPWDGSDLPAADEFKAVSPDLNSLSMPVAAPRF